MHVIATRLGCWKVRHLLGPAGENSSSTKIIEAATPLRVLLIGFLNLASLTPDRP